MKAEEARELSRRSRVPGAIEANINRALEGVREQAKLGEFSLDFPIRKSDRMELTPDQQRLVYGEVGEQLMYLGYLVSQDKSGLVIHWGDNSA